MLPRLQSAHPLTSLGGQRRAPLMPRFYCDRPLENELLLHLPDPIARHVQVLRLKTGDMITLFNGLGGEYTGTLTTVGKKNVEVVLKTFSAREAEPAHSITLVQGLPEGAKMDWIVEKAVELGVTGIQPLMCSRSVIRLDEERAGKKMLHWRAIMAAAAEQCGRNRLPVLGTPLRFDQWIIQKSMHRRVLLSPRATENLSVWARHQPPQAIALMVGPEGGWSEEEERLAQSHGALCLGMGERILRTETAGLAALATLQALWGGM
jgi:16S rRNA (uracil1498-N3)-methyltransferase